MLYTTPQSIKTMQLPPRPQAISALDTTSLATIYHHIVYLFNGHPNSRIPAIAMPRERELLVVTKDDSRNRSKQP
jgi:hypothetical protein